MGGCFWSRVDHRNPGCAGSSTEEVSGGRRVGGPGRVSLGAKEEPGAKRNKKEGRQGTPSGRNLIEF